MSKTAILPTNDVVVPIFSDSRFTTLISVSEWNWWLMVMDPWFRLQIHSEPKTEELEIIPLPSLGITKTEKKRSGDC